MARSSGSRSRGRRSRSGGAAARRTARRSLSRERPRTERAAERVERVERADRAVKNRSRSRGTRTAAASRSRDRRRRERSRSRSRARRRTPSKSRSRRVRRRSRSAEERIPPLEFGDYEPAQDGGGGGWYVYKKTGKWKYHPETGLYLHVKSKVYYVQKEGDAKSFRKIEDDDDPIVKKMRQSEEMRKAIQSTEFVKFDESGNPAVQDTMPTAEEMAAVGLAKASGPEPKPVEERQEDPRYEGRVQRWDADKGFGFIMALSRDEEEVGKGLFVHRKNIVGSTATNPINLKEGGKVAYKPGEQDNRPCALEVMMLGVDGKPLPIHADAQTLEEKKKSYYVTAEALGLRVHAESWPGLKKTLQDRYVSDEAMEELGVYFGVFDGHGGTQVADHAAKQLHKNIMNHFRQKQVQPASRDEKIKTAIREAFAQTDKEILNMAERKKFELVGSTAVTALLHGNPKLGTALRLVIANLGDSRAVLCRGGQAVAVSEDHKPTRVDEKKRIERAGGLVLQVRGAWRVAASTNPNSMSKSARREYQGLAMTRSFGDLYFKQPTLLSIAEPEIQIVPLSDKDLFLVLATDGIYDILTNQEVVDLVLRHWEDPEEAAKAVVRSAYKRGSEDNLTVTVIQFGWADKNISKYLNKKAPVALPSDLAAVGVKKGADIFAAAASKKPVDDDMDMFG